MAKKHGGKHRSGNPAKRGTITLTTPDGPPDPRKEIITMAQEAHQRVSRGFAFFLAGPRQKPSFLVTSGGNDFTTGQAVAFAQLLTTMPADPKAAMALVDLPPERIDQFCHMFAGSLPQEQRELIQSELHAAGYVTHDGSVYGWTPSFGPLLAPSVEVLTKWGIPT